MKYPDDIDAIRASRDQLLERIRAAIDSERQRIPARAGKIDGMVTMLELLAGDTIEALEAVPYTPNETGEVQL